MVCLLSFFVFFRRFRASDGLKKHVTVEAFICYWLSRYILLSGPKDDINVYVFPLVVCIAGGKRLSLGPLYLRLMYATLDECMKNIIASVGPYGIVTLVNSAFLQIFLRECFKSIAPKPVEFRLIVVTEEIVDNKRKKKKSNPYTSRA